VLQCMFFRMIPSMSVKQGENKGTGFRSIAPWGSWWPKEPRGIRRSPQSNRHRSGITCNESGFHRPDRLIKPLSRKHPGVKSYGSGEGNFGGPAWSRSHCEKVAFDL